MIISISSLCIRYLSSIKVYYYYRATEKMRSIYFLSLLGSALGYAGNVPPELSVIGNPNWTLPATFSVSSGNCSAAREVAVVPGKYLKTDGMFRIFRIMLPFGTS